MWAEPGVGRRGNDGLVGFTLKISPLGCSPTTYLFVLTCTTSVTLITLVLSTNCSKCSSVIPSMICWLVTRGPPAASRAYRSKVDALLAARACEAPSPKQTLTLTSRVALVLRAPEVVEETRAAPIAFETRFARGGPRSSLKRSRRRRQPRRPE